MNLDYAIGCKKLQRESQKLWGQITIDNVEDCQHYFRVIDFWNKQICKGMGWKYNG